MKKIWFIAGLTGLAGLIPVALVSIWMLKPHPQRQPLACCQPDIGNPLALRPVDVDVLGNAQKLHAQSDNLTGCLAKHGHPLFIPTVRPDGIIILFYDACT